MGDGEPGSHETALLLHTFPVFAPLRASFPHPLFPRSLDPLSWEATSFWRHKGKEGSRTGKRKVGQLKLLTNARMLRNYRQGPFPRVRSSHSQDGFMIKSAKQSAAVHMTEGCRVRYIADRLQAAPVIVHSDVSGLEGDRSSLWGLTMGLEVGGLGVPCQQRVMFTSNLGQRKAAAIATNTIQYSKYF